VHADGFADLGDRLLQLEVVKLLFVLIWSEKTLAFPESFSLVAPETFKDPTTEDMEPDTWGE